MGLRALTLASSAVRRDSRLTLLSRPIIPGTMHTSIHMRWASVFDSCHTVLIGWGAQLLAATQARLMRLDFLSFQTQHSLFSVSILLEYMYIGFQSAIERSFGLTPICANRFSTSASVFHQRCASPQ